MNLSEFRRIVYAVNQSNRGIVMAALREWKWPLVTVDSQSKGVGAWELGVSLVLRE